MCGREAESFLGGEEGDEEPALPRGSGQIPEEPRTVSACRHLSDSTALQEEAFGEKKSLPESGSGEKRENTTSGIPDLKGKVCRPPACLS